MDVNSLKKLLLLLFSIISLLTGIFFIGLFINNYFPFSIERTNQVVLLKKSEVGIKMFPAYYVYAGEDGKYTRHKVSKHTINSTKLGDKVSGYKIKDRFYTIKDIISDLFSTIIFVFVGTLFVMLGIIYFIRQTKFFQKFLVLLRNIRINEEKTKFFKNFLFIGALLFVSWKYILYKTPIYFKTFDYTSAEILRTERNPSYGRFNGPTFAFTVRFTLDDGEKVISKIKVSNNVYERYEEKDTIIVYYEISNPFYVYLPDHPS